MLRQSVNKLFNILILTTLSLASGFHILKLIKQNVRKEISIDVFLFGTYKISSYKLEEEIHLF